MGTQFKQFKKICVECGKEFIAEGPGSGARRTCSLECSTDRRRRLDNERAKKHFAKVYVKKKDPNEVSQRRKKRHEPVTKICDACGKAFIIPPEESVLKIFCSNECRLVKKRQNAKKYYDRDGVRPKKVSKNPNQPIVDLAIEARKHGMSYGQYVAQLKMKEDRKKAGRG